MTHSWSQTSRQSVTLSNTAVGDPSFTVPADAAVGTTLEFELTVTDKMTVTVISVEEANKAPVFDEGVSATREVAENSPAGTNVGTPLTATDPDGNTLTYSLSGDDAASFGIDAATGQLTTVSGVTYDYETKSTYAVTVTATVTGEESDSLSASIAVTVSLTTPSPHGLRRRRPDGNGRSRGNPARHVQHESLRRVVAAAATAVRGKIGGLAP